jgi:hypothetical protein
MDLLSYFERPSQPKICPGELNSSNDKISWKGWISWKQKRLEQMKAEIEESQKI